MSTIVKFSDSQPIYRDEIKFLCGLTSLWFLAVEDRFDPLLQSEDVCKERGEVIVGTTVGGACRHTQNEPLTMQLCHQRSTLVALEGENDKLMFTMRDWE